MISTFLALLGTVLSLGGAAHPRADPPGLNVILVLADDLRTDDVRHMPNVQALRRDGTSFSDYVVTDSRCCPSRASILTGEYPHNTGVRTNAPPEGGEDAFIAHGDEQRTFAVALQRAGYRTALYGKYLNGYGAGGGGRLGGVPPGWSDWAGTARGYREFDYSLDVGGVREHFGSASQDYLTDVLTGYGLRLLDSAAAGDRPFIMELASFAPHLPAVPAPRDAGAAAEVAAPRGPAFNAAVTDAPGWLARLHRLDAAEIADVDVTERERVRSLGALDDLVGRLRDRVSDLGLAGRTVFVFTSDNGFHLGEHRLAPGKFTAFDTDVRVPLIVAGPGIARGRTVRALTQETDLAPTFEDIAHAAPDALRDGRSLWPLLRGRPVPRNWRSGALIEHAAEPAFLREDPDRQTPQEGDPPSYRALRTRHTTYVEYATGAREFYDRRGDPDELHNAYRALDHATRRTLHRRLAALATCAGPACAR